MTIQFFMEASVLSLSEQVAELQCMRFYKVACTAQLLFCEIETLIVNICKHTTQGLVTTVNLARLGQGSNVSKRSLRAFVCVW